MALSGFPTKIQITLGSVWTPDKNGLGPSDVIVLTKLNSTDKWFEKTTTNTTKTVLTANNTTNRVRMDFVHFTYTISARLRAADGAAWRLGSAFTVSNTGDYTFRDLWLTTGAATNVWTQLSANGFISGTGFAYNPDILSAIQAYVAVDGLDVSEGATPIPDGTTAPREYASTESNKTPPTKTFTVENISAGTIASIAVTVPEGYTITEALATSLNAAATDTFTVQMDTNYNGLHAGNIVITSDDAESPYTFAVSGFVYDDDPKTHMGLDGSVGKDRPADPPTKEGITAAAAAANMLTSGGKRNA